MKGGFVISMRPLLVEAAEIQYKGKLIQHYLITLKLAQTQYRVSSIGQTHEVNKNNNAVNTQPPRCFISSTHLYSVVFK